MNKQQLIRVVEDNLTTQDIVKLLEERGYDVEVTAKRPAPVTAHIPAQVKVSAEFIFDHLAQYGQANYEEFANNILYFYYGDSWEHFKERNEAPF